MRIVVVMLITLIVFLLFSCARPQPYGEDLWKGLEYINTRNKVQSK